MAEDWERINDALLAASKGKSLTPHVSRQTLFGIPSSVETQMQAIVAEVARGAESAEAREKAAVLRERLAALAARYGNRIMVGRADRYFVYRARSAGYDIPAFPYARSGELQEFLEDESVESVPSWYRSLGVSEDEFKRLSTRALISYQYEVSKFRTALFEGVSFVDDSRFLSLENSTYISIASFASLESLGAALEYVLQEGEES